VIAFDSSVQGSAAQGVVQIGGVKRSSTIGSGLKTLEYDEKKKQLQRIRDLLGYSNDIYEGLAFPSRKYQGEFERLHL
jgi:hypothetical protein